MLLPCGGQNLQHRSQAFIVQSAEGVVQEQGHPRPCEEQLRQGKSQGKVRAVLCPCGKVIAITGDPVFVPQFHGKAGIHGEGTVFSSRGGGKIGFVIGNEGHGVRESVRSACTGSVIVPMCEGPESLNAAICASLLSWEVYRSRR